MKIYQQEAKPVLEVNKYNHASNCAERLHGSKTFDELMYALSCGRHKVVSVCTSLIPYILARRIRVVS
jgi:hypothetical protein